jgi:hypothetical protein
MLGDIEPEPHKNVKLHNCGFNFSIFKNITTFLEARNENSFNFILVARTM